MHTFIKYRDFTVKTLIKIIFKYLIENKNDVLIEWRSIKRGILKFVVNVILKLNNDFILYLYWKSQIK